MRDITFNNYKDKLTVKDIDDLVCLLTARCRSHTTKRLRAHLEFCRSEIPNYGILDRLIKDDYGWSYCAGQSYPDEIRTVRKIILDLK